ncbi:hypothetical protein PAXRUDRAFT_468787 [Paxillus rubicundulus Ve08.2h10]|uniref:Uncharacterized protein n=1 Tax=Paxillus rubicundulus Ve08.2h10 TaxID=930991 RepID=A0A0D0DWE5_9AGAM|nr:hypothetical protein PAXRUDRAFT_468787 [Paxillus rubicundulus Ve08.2h10]
MRDAEQSQKRCLARKNIACPMENQTHFPAMGTLLLLGSQISIVYGSGRKRFCGQKKNLHVLRIIFPQRKHCRNECLPPRED